MHFYANWHILNIQRKAHYSAIFLSKEIASSLVSYSVRKRFYYRKKKQVERSCEFIFMIDFYVDFYPEVLGNS